jgi:hypothetical protein
MSELYVIRLIAPEGANPSGINAAVVQGDSAEHALQVLNDYATRAPLMSGDAFDAAAYEVTPLAATVADGGGVMAIKGRIA